MLLLKQFLLIQTCPWSFCWGLLPPRPNDGERRRTESFGRMCYKWLERRDLGLHVCNPVLEQKGSSGVKVLTTGVKIIKPEMYRLSVSDRSLQVKTGCRSLRKFPSRRILLVTSDRPQHQGKNSSPVPMDPGNQDKYTGLSSEKTLSIKKLSNVIHFMRMWIWIGKIKRYLL